MNSGFITVTTLSIQRFTLTEAREITLFFRLNLTEWKSIPITLDMFDVPISCAMWQFIFSSPITSVLISSWISGKGRCWASQSVSVCIIASSLSRIICDVLMSTCCSVRCSKTYTAGQKSLDTMHTYGIRIKMYKINMDIWLKLKKILYLFIKYRKIKQDIIIWDPYD